MTITFDRQRHSRTIALGEVGIAGMERLGSSQVSVVGVGGLGSPVLLYLGAGGLGALNVIDGDRLEVSNLPRQVLYDELSLGESKAELAAARVRDIDGSTAVSAVVAWITTDNADELLSGSDVVVDCVDNFETRHVIDEWCVAHRVAHIWAGVDGWHAQVGLLAPHLELPCLACLFGTCSPADANPSHAVAAPICGIAGSMAAAFVFRLLACDGGRREWMSVVDLDFSEARYQAFELEPLPDCPRCGGVS